ncbi:MAG: hypothetical protein J5996_01075 [Prevotella sp.]|nr:hypothetical protein [Prevotella sp.]
MMNDSILSTEDKHLEAAMIKTCLLFDENIRKDRDSVFKKKLLSYLFDNRFDTVEKAFQVLKKEMPSYAYSRDKIETAIASLIKDGLAQIDDDGTISLSEDARKGGKECEDNQRHQLEALVDDITRDVRKNVSNIRNEAQVRQNIKECIDYYLRVCCYKFMGVDEDRKVNELPELEKRANYNLGRDRRLRDQILLSIGNVIEHPTPAQSSTLESMARCLITMRILGMDAMVGSFKQTVLRSKEFVLDTDFVLDVITEHGEESRYYKTLLSQLSACGCKIYIPKEIISEVYDHAEAATKRYHFVNHLIDANPGSWAKHNIRNVFVEAYYEKKKTTPSLSWPVYIGNYYNRNEGEAFTEDVVRELLDGVKGMTFCKMPMDYNVYDAEDQETIVLRDQLYQKALDATLLTIKGETRDDYKNERIAKTDTMLYLSLKKLNNADSERNGRGNSRKDLFKHKYYVITNTFRIYPCAKELGLDDKVFCRPTSLMAYLMEYGIIGKNDVRVTSLFDNSFLTYIAEKSWDDAEKMAKAGIDFKNVSIVKLRYDLQDNLDQLLTSAPGSMEYNNAIDKVKGKGYSFVSQVEYSRKLENIVSEKNKEIGRLMEELEKKNTQLARQRYVDRVAKKSHVRKHL